MAARSDGAPVCHGDLAGPAHHDPVRTRVHRDRVWAVIHESGHAIYENGVPKELWRSPLASPSSLGFHESQSRLWENWVGRGRPYLEHLMPRLRELFPARLGEVELDSLYRAANKIEPSLIRVEADQVTYNLHIILRFELEQTVADTIDLTESCPRSGTSGEPTSSLNCAAARRARFPKASSSLPPDRYSGEGLGSERRGVCAVPHLARRKLAELSRVARQLEHGAKPAERRPPSVSVPP